MARKNFSIVRDKFARDEGLPFGRLLPRQYVLDMLEESGHVYRNRTYCPLVTLWGWLSQCLSQDKSLNEAVSRILANRVMSGLPPCSASNAGYTQARNRFPADVMIRLAREVGRKVHESADDSWHWRGRQVFLADGTGFSMPDTPANQICFPQHKGQKRGLGLPQIAAIARCRSRAWRNAGAKTYRSPVATFRV